MREATLTIAGKPQGKHRPRFAKPGKFVQTYTAKEDVSFEQNVRLTFAAKYPDWEPITGPVYLRIEACCPIPKSYSKKKQALIGAGRLLPLVKPDFDNLAKIVADALNGVAYGDDKQVVSAHITKEYSLRPRTEITIKEL